MLLREGTYKNTPGYKCKLLIVPLKCLNKTLHMWLSNRSNQVLFSVDGKCMLNSAKCNSI